MHFFYYTRENAFSRRASWLPHWVLVSGINKKPIDFMNLNIFSFWTSWVIYISKTTKWRSWTRSWIYRTVVHNRTLNKDKYLRIESRLNNGCALDNQRKNNTKQWSQAGGSTDMFYVASVSTCMHTMHFFFIIVLYHESPHSVVLSTCLLRVL